MIVLTEQIEIPASYEKLKAWAANFEEEFVKWSPYHIECNLYNGNYNAGSKIRFREIVMGLDYDVTGTITECEQDENHLWYPDRLWRCPPPPSEQFLPASSVLRLSHSF